MPFTVSGILDGQKIFCPEHEGIINGMTSGNKEEKDELFRKCLNLETKQHP